MAGWLASSLARWISYLLLLLAVMLLLLLVLVLRS